MRAVDEGNMELAKRRFTASYNLLHRGSTLANLGHVEVKLGHVVEGLQNLKQALGLTDTADSQRPTIQSDFDAAYAKTGHLAIRTAAGARVEVDGTFVPGAAPFVEAIDVMPGHHVVEAWLPSRPVVRQEVDAPAGSVVEIELATQEERAVQPHAEPPAAIAPLTMDTATERPSAAPSWWTPPRIAGVALGAAAVVSLGTGSYFQGAGVKQANDVRGLRGSCGGLVPSSACGQLRSKVEDVHQDRRSAVVSWAVAGGALAGAIVAFVVGTQEPNRMSTGLTVRPSIAPGSIGLEGAF